LKDGAETNSIGGGTANSRLTTRRRLGRFAKLTLPARAIELG